MRTGVTTAIELSRCQSVTNRRNWRASERILVAVKLTEEGGELVTWALTHGSQSGDNVTVVHVVEPCPSLSSRKWERQKKDMLNTLSELVTYCRMHYDVPHLSTVVQVVESRSIRDAIVQEAQNLEATRVILGKRKSGVLGISPKKMTDLGRLCVRNLEPYCDVIIVKKGKVHVQKPGKAKFRRSLETLILSTKKQELYDQFEESNNARHLVEDLVVKDYSAHRQKSRLGPKPGSSDSSDNSLTTGRLLSSSSGKTNSSRDISFCSTSGLSSGGSEDSPISVLRAANVPRVSNQGMIDRIEKIDEGFSPSQLSSLQRDTASFTASSTPFSSQLEWLKGAGGPAPRIRSRSSSNSLEAVPELPNDRKGPEGRRTKDDRALVVVSKPHVGEDTRRVEDKDHQLALVCASVASDLEDKEQQFALVCASVAPELEDKEQQLALVCTSVTPELDERKDNWEGIDSLALVCCSPKESEGRKDEDQPWGDDEGALVLADYYLQESEEDRKGSEDGGEDEKADEEEGDEESAPVCLPNCSPPKFAKEEDEEVEEEGALVCYANCSPPKFARNCSEIKYNLSQDGLQSLSKEIKLELPEVRRFTYEELRAATESFAQGNVVGTGGASAVYRARLSDGAVVAVKKLVDDMSGEKEFMMEMMMLICALNHPNVVTIIGFCAEGPHRLIAYKLLQRGSLERNLHSANTRKLNWAQRQKVAFGASRGLAYLHAFSPMPIVHRDIKTSNILLGEDFEAQISDFGLARWLSDGDTTDDQVSCAGTFGYLAPECLMYGGFNERTDVFAFGVVLLELISGRRPMDERLPEMEQSLVLWARTLQQNGRTHHLVDQSLTDINPQQFKRMMYTAFLCVQVSPEDRPTMDRVVKLLDPNCSYFSAILQPNISAPPFISMPELGTSGPLSPLLPPPSINTQS